MEKKSNTKWYVIIGILAALILCLTVLITALVLGWTKKNKKDAGSDSVASMPDKADKKDADNGSDDIFAQEITEAETEASGSISIVIDGFKLQIPSDYGCFYSDEVGPVVYMDDVFQMKTGVRKGSYDEMMSNPDSLTEKSIAAGGEILQEVQEKELNGKKYAYFRMKLHDDESFVVYTQAADTDRRLAGQLVVESDNLTDEDLLNVFASIAASAKVTDEPNSSREDIDGQIVSADMGEAKEGSTLTYGSDEVTFQIPKGFYSQLINKTDAYMSEEFVSEDYTYTVDCFLESNEDFASAQGYIEDEADTLQALSENEVKVETVEVNGNTFYYAVARYKNDETGYQRIYAACDISDSSFYLIEASCIDGEEELTIDKIQKFLSVE